MKKYIKTNSIISETTIDTLAVVWLNKIDIIFPPCNSLLSLYTNRQEWARDFMLFLRFFPVLAHAVEFFFFVGEETSPVKGIPYFLHHGIVKVEVVQHAKPHAKHFLCL